MPKNRRAILASTIVATLSALAIVTNLATGQVPESWTWLRDAYFVWIGVAVLSLLVIVLTYSSSSSETAAHNEADSTTPTGREGAPVKILTGLLVAIIIVVGLAAAGNRVGILPGPLPERPDDRAIDQRSLELDSVAVYDPSGNPDSAGTVARGFDNDLSTSWDTKLYDAQFPADKPGIGVVLTLHQAQESLAQVNVVSQAAGMHYEVRWMPLPNVPLSGTEIIGAATMPDGSFGSVSFPNPPRTTKYLLLWITKLAQDPDGASVRYDRKYSASLNEVFLQKRVGGREY